MQTFIQRCVQQDNGWTIVGQCFVKLSNIWTVLCPTVQWLVYAVSNCSMACELSVQQSNGQTVLFPTVQWSDCAFSNCPMVGQSCVQLAKGQRGQGHGQGTYSYRSPWARARARDILLSFTVIKGKFNGTKSCRDYLKHRIV